MSGGCWNYKNNDLANEVFGWSSRCRYDDITPEASLDARNKNPFKDKEMSEMIHDVFCVIHALDYKECGDIGEYTYRETVQTFKDKWFNRTDEDVLNAYKNDLREYCEELIKELGNV